MKTHASFCIQLIIFFNIAKSNMVISVVLLKMHLLICTYFIFSRRKVYLYSLCRKYQSNVISQIFILHACDFFIISSIVKYIDLLAQHSILPSEYHWWVLPLWNTKSIVQSNFRLSNVLTNALIFCMCFVVIFLWFLSPCIFMSTLHLQLISLRYIVFSEFSYDDWPCFHIL
jgi:hypothetical protein